MWYKVFLSVLIPLSLYFPLHAQNAGDAKNSKGQPVFPTAGCDTVTGQIYDATIFPNPGDGNFNIDLGKKYSNVQVDVVNATGQPVQISYYTMTRVLNVELNGKAGTYFVIIRTNDQPFSALKVIKQ